MSEKGSNGSETRGSTKVINAMVIASLATSLASCRPNPNSSGPEGDNSPTPSEQGLGDIDINTPLPPDIEEIPLTPTFTEMIEEPTEEPTATQTEMPTATPTEEFYSPEAYSFKEEREKFGYNIVAYEFWGSEFYGEVGLSVIGRFVFEEYKVTDKGLSLVGTTILKNKEYPFEILLDSQISSYVAGNKGHPLDDKEAVEKWVKAGGNYYFSAFIRNNDGTLITPNLYVNNSNEEWKKMRSNIEEILTQGGSTPEFDLLLNSLDLIRY